MSDSTSGLGLDFSTVVAANSAAPVLPSDKTLDKLPVATTTQEEFSCLASLSDGERAQVRTISTQLIAGFKQDRQLVVTFGDGAMKALNEVTSLFIRERRSYTIPEVEKYTKQIAQISEGFNATYKDNPQLEAVMQRLEDSFKGIFNAGRLFLIKMRIDADKAYQRIDRAAAKVTEQRNLMERYVLFCDKIAEKNGEGAIKLITNIAILEQIRDDLRDEVEVLKAELATLTEGTIEYRNKYAAIELLADMLSDIEIKRTAFVSRLYVAWVTARTVRNLRMACQGMYLRLHIMLEQTIPMIPLNLTVMIVGKDTERASDGSDALDALTNKIMTETAAGQPARHEKILLSAKKPALTPQTMVSLATSLIEQNDATLRVEVEVRRLNGELEDVIVKQSRRVSASNTSTDSKRIEILTERASQPVNLGTIPVLPEEVQQLAGQQPLPTI